MFGKDRVGMPRVGVTGLGLTAVSGGGTSCLESSAHSSALRAQAGATSQEAPVLYQGTVPAVPITSMRGCLRLGSPGSRC